MRIYEPGQRTPYPSGAPPMLEKKDVQVYQGEGFSELGRGLNTANSAVEKAQHEEAVAWSANTMSDARLRWTEEFVTRQSTAEPGAAGFTPKLMEDYDKYMDETVNRAPTDAARNYTQQRLLDFRADLGSKSTVYEAQARVDYRHDQYTGASDKLSKLMQRDPAQFEKGLAELLASIDASDMPQIKKSDLREKTIAKVAGAAVWSQIQKSPTGFLQSIGFYGEAPAPAGTKTRKTSGDLTDVTGNVAFDMLPFERRAQAFQQAISTKATVDADAARITESQRKDLAAKAEKDLWERHALRTLKLEDVQAQKQVLDAPSYRALLEAVSKGPNRHDDPGAISHLTTLMYTDPAAAARYASTAYSNGKLADDTYRTESARAHSLAREGGLKSEFERSRAWIATTLNPGELIKDPVGRQRLGDALREFDDWMLNPPKKNEPHTDKAIRERAEEILDQYRFIDLRDSVMALRVPRGVTIRRTADKAILAEDIAKAGQKLIERRDGKVITPQEYNNEMGQLNKWRKALEQGQ